MSESKGIRGVGLTPDELRHVVGLSGVFALRMLGLFLVLPVLSIHAKGLLGATPFLAGMAVGFYGLSQTFFTVPMGLLSDRIGRKQVIVGGLLVYAAGSVISATSHSIGMLLLGRFIQGAGAISSAVIAMVADLTREEVRGRAMAVVGISIGASFALGFGVGPVISGHYGVPSLFWITGLLDLCAVAYIIAFVPKPPVEHRAAVSFRHLGSILSDRNLLSLNILMFILHVSLTAMWVVTPHILLERWERRQMWHVYLPMILLAGLIMLPAMGLAEAKKKLKVLLGAGIAVCAAGNLVLALSAGRPLQSAAGLVVFFVGFNLMEPVLPSLVTRFASPELRGTAVGVFNTSQFLGAFCGGALGGFFLGHGRYGLYWTSLALTVPWAWAAVRLAAPPSRTPVQDLGSLAELE
ncbi:MAG: MFS transporter [Elusimicrobia bacterium]|nr:MFS transporter [Elusimicrobiota bacterium]